MMNVHPSIHTTYYRFLCPEDAIRGLVKGGFHHGDFNYAQGKMLLARGESREKTARDFKLFLDDVGFSVPQAHLEHLPDLTLQEVVEDRKKEIDFFYDIGVRYAIVHLSGGKDYPQDVRREKNLASLRLLQDHVRGTDMTICVENMNSIHTIRDADRTTKIIEELGDANLGICLDTGHLNSGIKKGYTTETQGEFVRKAGSYLKALHINGNNGISDQHLAPYSTRGSVNYKEELEALHEINYSGLFNLEVDGEMAGNVPKAVLDLKLVYLKDLTDMMVTPDFWKN